MPKAKLALGVKYIVAWRGRIHDHQTAEQWVAI